MSLSVKVGLVNFPGKRHTMDTFRDEMFDDCTSEQTAGAWYDCQLRVEVALAPEELWATDLSRL